MKVFLSWSGARSKAVAELLNEWLRCVIQALKPWVSSRDIDRGSLWFNEISGQLSDTSIGIVCLTADNKTKPWILFEAGALAKGLTHSRVCTLLIDLQPSDIEDPLAQFNHTFPTHDSMWALVRTLNSSLQQQALDERILSTVFETYWPQFETSFKKILKEYPQESKPEKRTEHSLLAEILDNTRSLNSRVRDLESRIEGSHSYTKTVFNTPKDAEIDPSAFRFHKMFDNSALRRTDDVYKRVNTITPTKVMGLKDKKIDDDIEGASQQPDK